MTVREYIGARYVPVFSDPIQWDSTVSYEPLTVVMNQGTSYVSKQSVPAGIQITNETYWLRWADYNAQLEEYIRQVQQYNSRIQDNADDIADLQDVLPLSAFSSSNTVDSQLDTVDSRLDTIEENGWVSTNRIADNAVTSGKIANGTITYDDLSNVLKNKLIADASTRNECVIMLGDSYSQGVAAQDASTNGLNWQDLTESLLQLTDVYKYKAGSAGFVMTSTSTSGSSSTVPIGTTYNQVLNYAYDYINGLGRANEVKHIVIQGGWNDSNMPNFDYATIRDAAVTCINNMHTKFPNAKVYIIGTFCGNVAKSGNSNKSYVANAYRIACNRYGACFCETVNLPWLFDVASYDTIHPTNEMQRYIAAFIARALLFGHADDYEGIAANGVAYITKDHEIKYHKRYVVTTGEGSNVLIPANARCAFADRYSNQDTVQGYANLTDNSQGIALVRYYVDGSVKLIYPIQQSGVWNTADEIAIFLDHTIKFHGDVES